MQSFSGDLHDPRPRLLVVELWGLGDVAMALPFVQLAARHARVTLLAKPHAAVLAQHLCPEVEVIPFNAPWTAHRHKYRFARWPWLGLAGLIESLRQRRFAVAVSARPDPRDHIVMALANASVRAGFPRAGSTPLLTDVIPRPTDNHRRAYWAALAGHLGLGPLATPADSTRPTQRIVIHTGAAQPTREWPRLRFAEITARLRATGRDVTLLDADSGNLAELLTTLASADRFIGNDSGPGHVAALLGVPTFTIMGPYQGAHFHPVHPQAAWIEGAPCPHKPCRDYCRYDRPHCIQDVPVDDVWSQIEAWLA